MYIAEVPNRNSPPAILLRESFRENGKVKNRTLANLSSWPSSRVDALRRLLRGELDHAAVSDPTAGPTFGVLYALKHVAAEIGIGSALGQSKAGKLDLFLSWPALRIKVRVCRQYAGLAIRPSPKCSVWKPSTKMISTALWMILPPARTRLRRRSGRIIGLGVKRLPCCSSTMSPAPIWKANSMR